MRQHITTHAVTASHYQSGIRSYQTVYFTMLVRSFAKCIVQKTNKLSKVPMANGARNRAFRFAVGRETKFTIPSRGFKTTSQLGMWHGPPSTININKALNIAETINMYLEESNAALRLEEIRLNSRKDLCPKDSESMLDVFFGVSLHVIVPFGFSGDQSGLQNYTVQVGQVLQGLQTSTNDSDIKDLKEFKDLSDESWKHLLISAFGINLDDHVMSVDQIRAITVEISSEMQSAEFMSEIESNVVPLPMEKKQEALMSILIPLQMKVTDRYGMDGEDGYIIFQAHLMKNMADPQVQHNMAAAMSAIVQKAGIPMQ